MYYYKIGYSSAENSGYVELSHRNKISKEEFENMFIEATLDLLLNRRTEYNTIYTGKGEIADHEKNTIVKILKTKEIKIDILPPLKQGGFY